TWTQVYTGGPAPPMWERTTVDPLGRTIRVERPGFKGVETTERFYDARGRLVKTTPPAAAAAATLYEYDEPGNQARTGLDVDHTGSLEPASTDRITDNEDSFISIDGDWWRETAQTVYGAENDDAPTIVGYQRTRLTGLGVDGKTSETVTVDIHGKTTISRTFVNRAEKSVTRVTDHPDSTIDSTTVSINGVTVSQKGASGVELTFTHDALGRRTGVIDSRTGASEIHYNARGQVDYVEDAAGNRARYFYDPATGRKILERDPLDKATRYLYNERGQITHVWGDVPYPVQYVYDNYGRRTEIRTYRGGSNWSSAMWPIGATGPSDVTRMRYHEATGLP
ncbi:MAG: hypothetical protein GY859_43085, partial [Desulfobacterales bacterium]|nr:hypothetical protein [Desulfobacterales bacterium]